MTIAQRGSQNLSHISIFKEQFQASTWSKIFLPTDHCWLPIQGQKYRVPIPSCVFGNSESFNVNYLFGNLLAVNSLLFEFQPFSAARRFRRLIQLTRFSLRVNPRLKKVSHFFMTVTGFQRTGRIQYFIKECVQEFFSRILIFF